MLILLNKPYQVLSQFKDKDGRATLGDFVRVADVYPAGRLDYDSEGLILLTDDGRLQARISQPTSKITKTYWSQVEGVPGELQLSELVSGVRLKMVWQRPYPRACSPRRQAFGNEHRRFVTVPMWRTAGLK